MSRTNVLEALKRAIDTNNDTPYRYRDRAARETPEMWREYLDQMESDAAALRELKEALQELDWGYDDEWVVAYEFVGGLERLRRLLSDEEPPADAGTTGGEPHE